MNNYLLTLFIVYLGIGVGLIISYFTKEELNPGKKYFVFLKAILIGLILLFFFIHIGIVFYLSLIVSTLIFIGVIYWLNKLEIIYTEIFFSCLFAILFAESFSLIISTLIFGFFLVSATLDFSKKIHYVFISRILFLIIGILIRT
ncbi:hypothetical protein HN789_01855 [archaeon]|jgi:hypothetical protein|nr:hypothetical protein [archaeon]MBT4022559.1 hypothetical protein [archaeon]MBT4272885.1 hypothetical protein [archaeon]MBT4461685.1 hypothetical protein [archaeon]MBT4857547.1 hypothetical protein [archaeon]